MKIRSVTVNISQRSAGCCLMLLLLSLSLIGQSLDAPKFFKLNYETFNGVRMPVTLNGAELYDQQSSLNERYEASIRLPISTKGATKLIASLESEMETVPIFQAENDTRYLSFYEQEVGIVGKHAFNPTWELSSTVRVSSASSYALTWRKESISIGHMTLLKKTESDATEWGFGLATSKRRFNITILPVVMYKHYFNDKWYVDLLLPVKILFRKRMNDASEFTVGFRGNSENYLVGDDTVISDTYANTSFRRINIKGLASYELQLTKWVGLKAEGGALLPYRNGIYTLEVNRQRLHTFGREVAPYLNLGFFLAYPK